MTAREIVLSGYRLTRESFDTDAAWARAVEICEASEARKKLEFAAALVCDPATHDEMEQDEDGWHVIVIRCGGGCGKRANADEFIRDDEGGRYCAECWRALARE